MTVPTAVMLDDIGSSSRNIPASTHNVAGYVTGLDAVPWTAADWARFPNATKFRIAQGAGANPPINGYDIIDVERGAVTPATAAQMIHDRVHAGVQWTTVYGTDSTLAEVTDAVKKFGAQVWDGHVNYWLADWNLNEVKAAAKLGRLIHGASCVAVQWASPESNPDTIVPGGIMPLREANVDISVIDANWIPSGGFTGHLTVPTPVKVFHGILVTMDANGVFHARAVSSADDVNYR